MVVMSWHSLSSIKEILITLFAGQETLEVQDCGVLSPCVILKLKLIIHLINWYHGCQSFKKSLTVSLILKHYEQAQRIWKVFFFCQKTLNIYEL